MGVRIDENLFVQLGNLASGKDTGQKDHRHEREWRPPMGPIQQKAYDSFTRNLLVDGERGTGKSYVAGGHKLVRHLWRNFNALAVILVGVKSQATQGGIWEKLQTMILPEWKDNQGLEYTEVKTDHQKNLYIDVTNKFGGWSRVVLISAPFGEVLRRRIRGYEASYFFVEEGTTLDGPVYYTAVVQQVGRRKGISDPQQYVMACNPEGPSHWVYQRWFVMPIDPETGEHDPDWERIHIPYDDNIDPEEGYRKIIEDAVKGDPVEAARMLRGEWVDRPSGEAIFKDYFLSLHIRGEGKNRILPSASHPCVLGWDPGISNNAIVFLQWIPVRGRMFWVCFDAMVYLERRMGYDALVAAVMRRMLWWQKTVGSKLIWEHVGDTSAFNQFRPGSGSYDHMDIERESRRWLESRPEETELSPIKMSASPKFAGSVEARVRLMLNLLQREEFVVSRAVKPVIEMFNHLESEKGKEGKYDPSLPFTPRRSRWLHCFDAMTYPILKYDAKRTPGLRIGEGKMELVRFGS